MINLTDTRTETAMLRALFVGGVVDNSEIDIDGPKPAHYPENARQAGPATGCT